MPHPQHVSVDLESRWAGALAPKSVSMCKTEGDEQALPSAPVDLRRANFFSVSIYQPHTVRLIGDIPTQGSWVGFILCFKVNLPNPDCEVDCLDVLWKQLVRNFAWSKQVRNFMKCHGVPMYAWNKKVRNLGSVCMRVCLQMARTHNDICSVTPKRGSCTAL